MGIENFNVMEAKFLMLNVRRLSNEALTDLCKYVATAKDAKCHITPNEIDTRDVSGKYLLVYDGELRLCGTTDGVELMEQNVVLFEVGRYEFFGRLFNEFKYI